MRWDHLEVKTADMERSLHFYCDVLGLERKEDVEVLGRTFVFVGNDTISIELEPANPGDVQADPRCMTGMNHMAFIVEDVRALVERVKAAGVNVLLEPFSTRPGRLVSFIEDPDGVFIQLIELTEA